MTRITPSEINALSILSRSPDLKNILPQSYGVLRKYINSDIGNEVADLFSGDKLPDQVSTEAIEIHNMLSTSRG